jgi:hypothetical protein
LSGSFAARIFSGLRMLEREGLNLGIEITVPRALGVLAVIEVFSAGIIFSDEAY